MKKFSKLVEKILRADEPIVDGFKYEIISVNESEDFMNTLEFTFNVILPEPNQSYLYEKFKLDINNIINRIFDILGGNLNVRYQFLVDMKEPLDIYIKPSSVYKIIETVENKFQSVEHKLQDGRIVELELSVKPKKEDFYSALQDDSIDFSFNIDVKNIKINGEKFIPNEKDIKSLNHWIYEILNEMDSFRVRMEDDIYDIINPEMQINSYDIFIQCIYNISSVCGFDGKFEWGEKKWKFPTEIS